MGTGQRTCRGQVLLEYGIALAGFALVALVAIAVFGAKTAGQVEIVTSTAPGAHPGDNGPTDAGFLVPLRDDGPAGAPAVPWGYAGLTIDFSQIAADNDGTHARLGEALGSNTDPYDGVINNVFEMELMP